MDLNRQIDDLRERMVSLASKRGFGCPEVIAISQKLDDLMNDYDKLKGVMTEQPVKEECKC